jgi:hypothetical protein
MKRQFFLALLVGAAGLFAACQLDEKQPADVGGGDGETYYSITIGSVTYNGDDESGIAEGAVVSPSAVRAGKGDRFTLTVVPPEASVVEAGGEQVYHWRVDGVYGAYTSKEGKTIPVGGKSKDGIWEFTMPEANLTINVAFTTKPLDETNAYLAWLGSDKGELVPNFSKDTEAYSLLIPHDAEDFRINAWAENPYLDPSITLGGGGDSDDKASDQYTITVTPTEGTSKTYQITVIRLPDLSLKTFEIVHRDGFKRVLAPRDTQPPVYIPYTEGLTVVADANDDGADVTIDSENPVLTADTTSYKEVTVTVSKPVEALDAIKDKEYTEKEYKLSLRYSAVDLKPLASGGYVNFLPVAGTEGVYYEVHTFLESDTLSFTDTPNLIADILVVGGGGGAGGSSSKDSGGGGGGGGVVYGQGVSLTDKSTLVEVGSGGIGGSGSGYDYVAASMGVTGGDSRFGDNVTAFGGGGGGGAMGNERRGQAGNPGGSGGGGGCGYKTNNKEYGGDGGAATKGNAPTDEGWSLYGNPGGSADNVPADGAVGGSADFKSDISGTELEYGKGGVADLSSSKGADITGMGGSNGGNSNSGIIDGGAGGSGVVIVRFPHPGNEASLEDGGN